MTLPDYDDLQLGSQSPVRLKIFNLINKICYDCTNTTNCAGAGTMQCGILLTQNFTWTQVRVCYDGALVTWTRPVFSSPRTCEDLVCGLRFRVIQYNSSEGALK